MIHDFNVVKPLTHRIHRWACFTVGGFDGPGDAELFIARRIFPSLPSFSDEFTCAARGAGCVGRWPPPGWGNPSSKRGAARVKGAQVVKKNEKKMPQNSIGLRIFELGMGSSRIHCDWHVIGRSRFIME